MTTYQKLKESDTWVEYIYSGAGGPRTTRANKYPVVGGPYDGQMLTSIDLEVDTNGDVRKGYFPYNRASGGTYNRLPIPKQIWVWFGGD